MKQPTIHFVGKQQDTFVKSVQLARYLNQEHGNTIVSSTNVDPAVGDAWRILGPGMFGVKVADCLGVVLWETSREFPVYAIHSGWRGSKSGIVAKCAQELVSSGADPLNIKAYFSPSAQACCYEVGAEFMDYFGTQFVVRRNGTFYFDNIAYNVAALTDLHIQAENIQQSSVCTMCNTQFHSYRREGTSKRNVLLVEVGQASVEVTHH